MEVVPEYYQFLASLPASADDDRKAFEWSKAAIKKCGDSPPICHSSPLRCPSRIVDQQHTLLHPYRTLSSCRYFEETQRFCSDKAQGFFDFIIGSTAKR
jgi:hypothetical protein